MGVEQTDGYGDRGGAGAYVFSRSGSAALRKSGGLYRPYGAAYFAGGRRAIGPRPLPHGYYRQFSLAAGHFRVHQRICHNHSLFAVIQILN